MDQIDVRLHKDNEQVALGVGTETQIISPEIYAKADQNKFVGVASEIGEDRKPFPPWRAPMGS
jgi:hypothetical protein